MYESWWGKPSWHGQIYVRFEWSAGLDATIIEEWLGVGANRTEEGVNNRLIEVPNIGKMWLARHDKQIAYDVVYARQDTGSYQRGRLRDIVTSGNIISHISESTTSSSACMGIQNDISYA